jgi:hypothetical protein
MFNSRKWTIAAIVGLATVSGAAAQEFSVGIGPGGAGVYVGPSYTVPGWVAPSYGPGIYVAPSYEPYEPYGSTYGYVERDYNTGWAPRNRNWRRESRDNN